LSESRFGPTVPVDFAAASVWQFPHPALANTPLGRIEEPEDVARLSPLGFRHINLHGHYHFALPDFVTRGELRPLHEPDATDDVLLVGT